MAKVIIDPESTSLQESYALVYVPKRKRSRFHESCVTLLDSEQQAIAEQQKDKRLLAAKVYGPSSSSEGQRIYYLIRWLTH